MRITFIGGGNMATALIAGLLRQGHAAEQISVVEHNAEVRARLAADFQVTTYAQLCAEAVIADAVVLAVKPQQLKEAAQALSPLLATQLVVSIAAGVRARTLSAWLMGYANVVRSMPNTPAMIGAGVTALYALPAVQPAQHQMAETILKSAGSVLWVDDEALMDAVTAVSGSGPAYVFYFIEAMQQAALELGLDADAARQLALETMLGSAQLAAGSSEDAATLRARVTSKAGTTERALQRMDDAGVKTAIVGAIHAAAERSAELGDELQ
ncbi:MAG: pyrroline-5-carboxylate reductase [Sulfuriferula sp.]